MNHKTELRQEAQTRRAALSAEEKNQKSKQIRKTLLALKRFKHSQNIMIYLNFGDEVETQELAESILMQGKNLIVPYCSDSDIIPCLIHDLHKDLKGGIFGIPEPHPDRLKPIDSQKIDFICIPGVGFDVYGNRLGYGKGYYDRFLAQLQQGIPRAGLAFWCQILEKIPSEEHDVKMSLLITENGVIYPG